LIRSEPDARVRVLEHSLKDMKVNYLRLVCLHPGWLIRILRQAKFDALVEEHEALKRKERRFQQGLEHQGGNDLKLVQSSKRVQVRPL
jgi:hypothetical protein